jgi:hypothetical protein
VFSEDWDNLTPDQRFEARMRAWLEPANVEFTSDEARQAYRERVQMLRDAIELKKPVRVPIAPWIGLFPAKYSGMTAREAYYDFAKLAVAWQKFHADFRQDVLAFSINIAPCELFDVLDYRLYDWPGHGVPVESGYQYKEREWMTADEYDLLIADPSNYWQRFYLPRVFGALEPWSMLSPFTDLVEAPLTGPFFIPFGLAPVQEMLKTIAEAGRVALDWVQTFAAMDGTATATYGLPAFAGGATKAPFDILGDTMRGTRGLMLDKFRRPEKVRQAMERLVPLAIDWARRAADVNRHPLIFIPLHKGADGFLSDEDFRDFYWPPLKAVLKGLIAEGIVPLCFAEGGYNQRLEAIRDPDIPAGRMVWMFDTTDMVEARKHLGGYQCFGGNVPGALLTTASGPEVEEYVRKLLADVAGPGGFILGSGIVIDEANPECLKAMIEAGRKYGAQV